MAVIHAYDDKPVFRSDWPTDEPTQSSLAPPLWRDVPLARRRAVLRAIRSGELLRDPADAELLLRYTPSMRRASARRRHPARLLVRLTTVLWLAWEVAHALFANGHGRTVPVALVVPVLYLMFDVYVLVQTRRTLPRVERAEARHRDYLLAMGHSLPAEAADAEAARQPVRPELIVAFTLCAASVVLFLVVQLLPMLRDHHSNLRLVVYGLFGFTAIMLGLGASGIAARSWQRARGFERRSEPAVFVVVGLTLAASWALGMFNVFFHGA